MTDPTVLADALTAAGIGGRGETTGLVLYYVPDQDHVFMVRPVPPEEFISDWRVAGRCLEALIDSDDSPNAVTTGRFNDGDGYYTFWRGEDVHAVPALPRAICEVWYKATH